LPYLPGSEVRNDGTPEQQLRQREQVLAWLRVLHARANFFLREIDYIGVNLKIGVIPPEEALIWIDELDPGLRPLVEANR
jgi:hypothetical protein